MAQDANPPDDAAWNLAALGYEPTASPPAHNLTTDVAWAIGFSPDALPANRAGQMTDGQVDTVQAQALKRAWPAFVMFCVFALVLVIRPATGRYGRPIVWDTSLTTAVVVFGIVLVLLALLFPATTWVDARLKRARMAQGPVTRRSMTNRHGATVYYLHINHLDFEVPRAGFDLLPDGVPCRVYYTPITKMLLSLELV